MKEVVTKQTQEKELEFNTLVRVQSIVDEYGDFSSQPGVVREAGFAFPNSAAVLRVEEIVDTNNLDGPSVLKVRGGDDRNAEWRLSSDEPLSSSAEAALQRDLDLYVNPEKAKAFKKLMKQLSETALKTSRRPLR